MIIGTAKVIKAGRENKVVQKLEPNMKSNAGGVLFLGNKFDVSERIQNGDNSWLRNSETNFFTPEIYNGTKYCEYWSSKPSEKMTDSVVKEHKMELVREEKKFKNFSKR